MRIIASVGHVCDSFDQEAMCEIHLIRRSPYVGLIRLAGARSGQIEIAGVREGVQIAWHTACLLQLA